MFPPEIVSCDGQTSVEVCQNYTIYRGNNQRGMIFRSIKFANNHLTALLSTDLLTAVRGHVETHEGDTRDQHTRQDQVEH